MRWYHPTEGIIPPSSFIPVFERNGFVTEVDAFVWEEVCRYLRNCLDQHKRVVPISANMSRINLQDPHICEKILAITKKYDIDPELLHLEITESAYAEAREQLLTVVSKLKQSGFKILLDDFGSGYSSLNIIKELSFDILKIDRDFITHIEDTERGGSVLGSVIRLARRLGVSTIAEGVETEEQFKYLRGIGCDAIQGYYFSKPLPLPDFDDMVLKLPKKVAKTEPVSSSGNDRPLLNSDDMHQNKIMIVDDSVINRTMLKAMLSKEYRIEEAANGREAINLLHTSSPHADLVLLDIVMPVMNGYDFLEETRNDPAFQTMPILVLTGSETYENEIMALEYGANDYLKKPYNPLILNLKVANLLKMYSLTKANDSIRSIIGNIPGGIIVFEAEAPYRIRYLSRCDFSAAGISSQEFLEQYGDQYLGLIAPEEGEYFTRELELAKQEDRNVEIDYHFCRKDGSREEHTLKAQIVEGQTGEKLCYGIISGGCSENAADECR